MKKDKEISEDDLFKLQDDAQKETDGYIGKIDSITVEKEKEVMEVANSCRSGLSYKKTGSTMTKEGEAYGEYLPRHVAIIMDGNGRWAENHGKPRLYGHRIGADSVREIVECAAEEGIEVLTLYAFSSENWQRPRTEVKGLMSILQKFLVSELDKMMRHNIRLFSIGERGKLPVRVREKLEQTIEQTANNTGLTLNLALSYGAKNEMVHGVREIARKCLENGMRLSDINEQTISDSLYTRQLPDPDLLIRTGGEHRLSNFLLWQASYAEILFTDIMWPEYRRDAFREALQVYKSKERRFGRTGAQGTFTLFALIVYFFTFYGSFEFIRMDPAAGLDFRGMFTLSLLMSLPVAGCFFAQELGLSGGLLLAICLGVCQSIASYGSDGKGYVLLQRIVFGTVWIGFFSAHLLLLWRLPEGRAWLLLLVAITASSDSGAYYFGKHFGKRKLAPAISPKKTVEGALGGILTALVVSGLIAILVLERANWAVLLPMTILLVVVGIAGDLVESMVKRSTGTKDSGGLFLGHGGVLDRVDSLLLSAPLLYYIHVFTS
ncbi:unnamed protein product [Cyprideis torosa]|uniref:Ribosome-recycling factor, mitochondrial n=1 Tax=Cyprideis torosa TaxID=163714 RepID=A0A7R8WWQ3_9CRUS|nr:unnamed protein product [Cyprideis torosa]CAG0908119.1 unnamed protein product [Cyprideis torosa]